MNTPNQLVRLKLDINRTSLVVNDYTRQAASIRAGSNAAIECGAFEGKQPIDLSDVSVITFAVRPYSASGLNPQDSGYSILATVTASAGQITDIITASGWGAGTEQNMIFKLSASATSIAPGDYWLVVQATTPAATATVFPSGGIFGLAGVLNITGLTAGSGYFWNKGNATSLDSFISGVVLTSSGPFTADAPNMYMVGTQNVAWTGEIYSITPGRTITLGAGLLEVLDSGVL